MVERLAPEDLEELAELVAERVAARLGRARPSRVRAADLEGTRARDELVLEAAGLRRPRRST